MAPGAYIHVTLCYHVIMPTMSHVSNIQKKEQNASALTKTEVASSEFGVSPSEMVQARSRSGVDSASLLDHLAGPVQFEGGASAREQLEQIPTQNPGDVRQPETDLDSLLSQARGPNVMLMHVMQSAVEGTNAVTKVANMKSRERAQEKMDREQSDASIVTDAVRGTIVADDFESLIAAYNNIQSSAHCTVVRVKNRFGNPKANNYRDLQIVVSFEGGILAEVQFHMQNIMAIKNGPEHHWYEIKQKLEKDGLIDRVPDVIQAGDDKYAAEYQAAYESYDTPDTPAN